MSYDTEVAADSPYAYWKLNETSGATAADSSGNSRDGTVSGSGYMQGIPGPGDDWNAIDLGSDGYINTGITPSGWSGLTYECWVSVPADSTTIAIAASRNGSTPGIMFGTNRGVSAPGAGKLVAGWDKDSVWLGRKDTGLAINNGGWCHVACTWQGGSAIAASQFKVLLNGEQVDDTNDTFGSDSSTTLSSAVLYIGNGKTQGGVGDFAVARFALYNAALSAERIAAHYNAFAEANPVTFADASAIEQATLQFSATEGSGAGVPRDGQLWPRGNR